MHDTLFVPCSLCVEAFGDGGTSELKMKKQLRKQNCTSDLNTQQLNSGRPMSLKLSRSFERLGEVAHANLVSSSRHPSLELTGADVWWRPINCQRLAFGT